MDKENQSKKDNKELLIILLKIFLTGLTLVLSWIVGIILPIILSINEVNIVSTLWSALLLPTLLIPLIYCKNRKKVLLIWGIFALLFGVVLGVDLGIKKYEEGITIDTSVNINCDEYLPFVKNSKIVKLDYVASLRLKDNLPVLDGAAAVFPVYSAFVNATYPDTVKLNDGTFEYTNTVNGYKALALKETDIFFGAYPSEEQINYAKQNNTEFEYTEIGKEAFVFFVHKDNPVDSLTTKQIKQIYSGVVTNWKQVGGNDEEIVAFQRNTGSGSQSMLVRFMDGTPIMKAPTEQVNDFMSGIIEQVSDYKNKTNSIGFSFRYYLEGIIKNPNVKMIKIDGIEPNIENIKDGKYPITTSLYAVTYKGNDNMNVKSLIDWVLSEEGQEIIEKTGYVGIK